ncbi:MAG: hypothetical protein M3461_04565, partial [Pseudomonadota bacterium]|nr:hypothetical protein [Pseudomonadota bacterium]
MERISIDRLIINSPYEEPQRYCSVTIIFTIRTGYGTSPFHVETSRRFADDCRTEKDVGGVDSGRDDPPEDRTA